MSEFPNEKQKVVLEHRGKPLVVVAGPGTGKTTTLVQRIIGILKQDIASPVALITFTRLSRRTSDRDITKSVNDASEEIPGTEIPRVSTVHTFAKSLVHTYVADSQLDPDFHVLLDDCGEVDLIVNEALDRSSNPHDLNAIKEMIYAHRDSGILVPPDNMNEIRAREILQKFDENCKFYNAIDIQSLVVIATQLLEQQPTRLTPLFLHVDEYQDLNIADQRLIEVLANSERRQVVAVGDDAQSIYRFRHADHLGIQRLFKNALWSNLQFDESIRMTPAIKRASQALLLKSEEAYLSSSAIEGGDPNDVGVPLLQVTKSLIELKAVTMRIIYLKEQGVSRKNLPLKWKDFMILCPSRVMSDSFMNALTEAKIPCKSTQRPKPSIGDMKILLALRLVNADDSLALRQCLDLAGYDLEAIKVWVQEAKSKKQRLFEYLRKIRTDADVVITSIDNARNALSLGNEKFLSSMQDIPGLRATSEELSSRGLDTATVGDTVVNPKQLIRKLYEQLGVLDSEPDISDDDKVLVTTIHSSKGLEAEIVFIVGMNKGLMPQPKQDPGEQRRLLYVAMTRAKKELYLSFLERSIKDGPFWKHEKKEAASPFLLEIAEELELQELSAKNVEEWAIRPQV